MERGMRLPIKKVIKFAYYGGKYSEQEFDVRVGCERMSYLSVAGLQEALFNGIKRKRLGQFHFQRPNAAVLVADAEFAGFYRNWFQKKVERLKRRGNLVEIKAVHTSCKDCVFATYENKTQVGCAFGRLDAYKRRFGKAAVAAAYDDDKEFFIVNGHACGAKRHCPPEPFNVQSLVRHVRQELTAKVDFVVMVKPGDDIIKTVESIKAQTVPAFSVVFLPESKDVSVPSLHMGMREVAAGMTWSVTSIKERAKDGSFPDRGRLLDLVTDKMKGHFYTVLSAGATVPPDFIEKIDRAVTDELATFMVVRPEHGEGLTVAHGFHRSPLVGGHRAVYAGEGDDEIILEGVEAKAEFMAHAHALPGLVVRRAEVCK
jgi:hypothetical protein